MSPLFGSDCFASFSRYHKGSLLKMSDRLISSLVQDQSRLHYLACLTIKNVQKSDSGEYKVIAKNKNGEGSSTVNLNFSEEDGKLK